MRLDQALARVRAIRDGAATFTGWTALASPGNAAALARGGFGLVCADMQHGLHDEASVFGSIHAVHHAGGLPGVRIPVGRFELASRALDAGAQFVIAPMINTARDAKDFVSACKYPPVGGRSWGPAPALDMWEAGPEDYLASANEIVMTFAMIETDEAVENLDAILAVPGIDAVFVGPSDLSITLSKGARLQPAAADVLETASAIAQKATDAGKVAAIYAFDADKAHAFLAAGFSFCAVGSDLLALKAFARASVSEA
ncbi:MAG: hypothetical protein KI785_00615 [Devosiaceae bacterium]|nr:hypothetical protein [Devosiaceae bacterium MH13]